MISQLSQRADKPVNITQWINYFAADVMGDLAFGKSFNMIGTAGDHFILFDQLKPIIGFTQCVPWLFVLFQNLPIISGKRKEWSVVMLTSFTGPDVRYFDKPDEVIPERWSSQPELIHAKEAFNPFLIGAYSCVGKNLAYMEMRLLIYYIFKNFTFSFPAGTEKEMAELFDSQRGFKDYFTASAPDFDLVFSPRSVPLGD